MANPWENDPVVGAQAPGQVFTLPPNPKDARAAANEAERIRLAQEAAARAAAADARAASEAERRQREWTATHNADGSPKLNLTQKPTLTAKERADALAGYTSAGQLDRIISQLEEQYKVGPGATSGIAGWRDYLPKTKNKQFDSTGNSARGVVGSALGFTGGQLNTATEAEMAVGPYLPQASDRDQVILDKIQRLKELRDLARQRSVAILGGVPDVNGNVTPVAPQNAMTQNMILPGSGPTAAAPGSTQQQVPIPGPMQDEYNAWLAQNAGTMSPDSYVKFRGELDRKYGFGTDEAKNRAWAEDAIQRLRQGGATLNPTITGPTAPMSGLDQFRNNVVNNDLGAAAAQTANMGTFGIPELLAPDQMQALDQANPLGSTVGQIVGSVGGSSVVGALGRSVAKRLAPRLLGGGSAAQATRNVLADAGYSGTYGQVTQGDALPSAGAGAVGSAFGQGAGKAIGKAVGGLDIPAVAQALRSRNIPLTVGQTIGGPIKSIEDALTSAPGVGDIVSARRLEGLEAFNREALNEAGRPIGATVRDIGENGLGSLTDEIGKAYDNATAGVSINLDPQFSAGMAAARGAGSKLPPDLATRFGHAIDNRVAPIEQGGVLTGEGYQQAMRGLKSYRAEATKPGFDQDYRDSLGLAMGELTGQMNRGGGDQVVQGLGKANEAYRLAKVVKQAMASAKNGAGSGAVQVFTPAQLNTAAYAAQKKFPGARPFGDLADAGQKVLPSQLPDSGTGKRLATLALPGVLGGTGAGIGYAGGDAQSGAATGIAAGALLALGGTKAGQKLITEALTGRPEAMKRLGRKLGKRSGIFGAATLPFALEVAK